MSSGRSSPDGPADAACDRRGRGKGEVPAAPALRIHPQLDHRPRQHDPLDAGLPREQGLEPQLGLHRLHRQSRRATHAGRRRERDVRRARSRAAERTRARWRPDTTRSRPVRDLTCSISRSRTRSTGAATSRKVTAPTQQAAQPQPGVSHKNQPPAALPAAPGLGASHLGPRRRMVRHGGDLGQEGGPARLGCCNQHNALVQIMSQAETDGSMRRGTFPRLRFASAAGPDRRRKSLNAAKGCGT